MNPQVKTLVNVLKGIDAIGKYCKYEVEDTGDDDLLVWKRGYFGLANIVIFEDGKVCLSVIPSAHAYDMTTRQPKERTLKFYEPSEVPDMIRKFVDL